MSEVYVKYNPYTVKTDIRIDDKNFDIDAGKHLQEWVEELPKYITSKGEGKNFKLTFHGTNYDYEDVVEACEQYVKKNSEFNFEINYEAPTEEVIDKIGQITEIFEEIQAGDVEELKTPELADAFEKAKSDEFPINVVATMSAGKSTLINSLLGDEVMPSSQEACTAIITNIKDNDDLESFKATVFDKQNTKIAESDNVTLKETIEWNSNEKVAIINMEGDIPFVKSNESDSNLVLIDTPGPNNSRNEEHKKTTWKMLGKSSKTLVLYVLNATQLGTKDDKKFLTRVKDTMSVGGKQSRDRFIFVVNKLDDLKAKTEDVTKTLANVRSYLENDIGIDNPNIYAASALNALQLRTILKDRSVNELDLDDDDEYDLLGKIRRAIKREDHHFEQYAPKIPSVKREIDNKLSKAIEEKDKKEQALIYSGVPTIESAIKLYVEKYAIPAKISNIVATFEASLKKANIKHSLENEISKNEKLGDKLRAQAAEISSKLESAKNGKELQSKIDKISYSKLVEKEARKSIKQAISDFNEQINGLPDELEEYEAKMEYESLVQEVEDIRQRVEVELNELVEFHINEQTQDLIDEYRNRINTILDESDMDMELGSPIEFIHADIESSVGNIEQMNVQHREAEYHFESQKKWYNPFTWFKGDKYVEDAPETNFVEKKDFVNMFSGVQPMLVDYVPQITAYAEVQEAKTRKFFEYEFERLTSMMQEEMKSLENVKSQKDLSEAEIEKNRQTLEWLASLETKLNNVLSV